MEGLPVLPGYDFNDPAKHAFHRNHTLGYRNGFTQPKANLELGVGGEQLQYNQVSQSELQDLMKVDPLLTYGQLRKAPPVEFVPAHVAFDKKVLRFFGYWKQTVYESQVESYRVRPITLLYYLEDDSICIVEPEQRNTGYPQGKLIRRQQLPKNDQGCTWHWKDLNNGINFCVYGKTFRITSCDKFTKEFLESEGIVMNCEESVPADPYLTNRNRVEELRKYNTPSDYDKLRQFLEMDRKVLRFNAVWDDRDEMYGEMRKFIIHYYLADDTLEIRECHSANDGRDPFPLLVSRHRAPKDRKNIKQSHPLISMELSEKEIPEYFSPRDFAVGRTITVYGRRFLLYECDDFTKAWYFRNFGVTDFNAVELEPRDSQRPPKMELPPYNGYGTLDDSLQNCIKLVPEPPKKDFVKMMDLANNNLRFEAVLDTVKPEDKNRIFIITYRLSDDYICVYEKPVRNSGHRAGKFLEPSRVSKPGSLPDAPVYYGPQDFYIGAVVEIFRRRFLIQDCDEYVLKFMLANLDQFSAEQIESVRQHLQARGGDAVPRERRLGGGDTSTLDMQQVDLARLADEIGMQLKKLGIIGKQRIDELFLQFDEDRTGFVTKDKLRKRLRLMHLPIHDELVSAIASKCTLHPEGKINLEEFRQFFES